MRCPVLVIAALALAAAPLAAQTRVEPPLPIPDAKPPALEIVDDDVQPTVTIRKRGTDTVEEYRINGRLYKVTITPENAPPYSLIDPTGDGNMVPHDSPGTPHLSVPMWVIGTF